MATGDLAQQVSMIGDIAARGDKWGADQCRANLILAHGLADPFRQITVILSEIDANIGYLAGYLTPDLGNAALKTFGVKHPVFGDRIPTEARDALEVGLKLGKAYDKKLQAIAEAEKKAKFAAEHGVALPESEDTVSNDDAAKLLESLRKKREAKDPAAVMVPGLPPGATITKTDEW